MPDPVGERVTDQPCASCGHPQDWHRHYHDKNYCGTCDCRSYRRPPGRFPAWLERVLG